MRGWREWLPSKHTTFWITFVQCWTNVKKLFRRCTNVIQMFCAYWVLRQEREFQNRSFYIKDISPSSKRENEQGSLNSRISRTEPTNHNDAVFFRLRWNIPLNWSFSAPPTLIKLILMVGLPTPLQKNTFKARCFFYLYDGNVSPASILLD